MVEVPDFVTHYYLAAKQPFLNLSELNGTELEAVRLDLQARREVHGNKRPFGRKYMELRRQTEAKMYALFLAAGGKPQRLVPHYFVLGRSPWFEGHAPDTRSVVLAISALPDDATSFTYPDSFESMALGPRFGLKYEPRPYHEKMFRLSELPDVVATFGLPSDPGDQPFGRYIEVQLWSDDPVREYLT
jgi:hypothetical protein